MVLVAQKNGVDVGKLIHLDRWVVVDFEGFLAAWGRPLTASRGEEWIGKERDAINVEDCCGSPDMSDADLARES